VAPQGLKPVGFGFVFGTAEEAAEKLHRTRKGDHRGGSPHTFKAPYAALKGRSSTAMHAFVSFSATSEAVPFQSRALSKHAPSKLAPSKLALSNHGRYFCQRLHVEPCAALLLTVSFWSFCPRFLPVNSFSSFQVFSRKLWRRSCRCFAVGASDQRRVQSSLAEPVR
jgi:hypothetical protein